MTLSPKLYRQVIAWLAVGVAVYGVTVLASGWEEIRTSVISLGVTGWLAVLGLSTLNFAVRFVRWQFYLNTLGYSVPAGRSLLYFLGGFAFISTPAKAGEAVRALYLKQHDVRYTDSLAALFVERLTDLIAVVLLAASAAFAFEDLRWPVAAAAVLTLAFLPLIHSKALRAWLASQAGAPGKVRQALAKGGELLERSSGLLSAGPLYIGMVLSVLGALSISATMYLVLTLLGVEISAFMAVSIYATGILVGALSFLPGGIGSAEATMLALLVLAGIDTSLAVSAILICRVAGLWYPVAVGLCVVLRLGLDAPGSETETEARHEH